MGRGLLVVVSGFSGSGKSTVTKELVERYEGYSLSISATTRAPREGEKEGVDYFFKSDTEFRKMIDEDAFLEYAYYVGNGYGTPAAFVEAERDAGRDVLLEIEIQGAQKVKARCPDAILVFVAPPTTDELVRRLRSRATESEEIIISRLRRAVDESSGMGEYEYLLINDDLDKCVDDLHRLLVSQHMRMHLQAEFIETVQKELAQREEIRI